MRKTLTMLTAMSALGLSGCASDPAMEAAIRNSQINKGIEKNNSDDDPGFSLAMLGALAGARGGYLGSQGNVAGANAGQTLSVLAGGAAEYKRQQANAEAQRSQQNIYINQPQQNEQPVYRQPTVQPEQDIIPSNKTYALYSGNGWRDLNGNGIVEINEIEGFGKRKFSAQEPVELGIMGRNNVPMEVKFFLRNVSTNTNYPQPTLGVWGTSTVAKVNYNSNSLSPGFYKFYVSVTDNSELESLLFEVTN